MYALIICTKVKMSESYVFLPNVLTGLFDPILYPVTAKRDAGFKQFKATISDSLQSTINLLLYHEK